MNSYTVGPLKHLHHPDVGILLTRVALGVVGVFHGGQKLFGWWGGSGLKGFAGYLESMKVPMPEVSAWLAALAEFGGGIMIAVGLLTRLMALPYAFTMAVAWVTAHHMSFLKESGGSDFPFVLALVALALVFTGPGKFSMQALLSGEKPGKGPKA